MPQNHVSFLESWRPLNYYRAKTLFTVFLCVCIALTSGISRPVLAQAVQQDFEAPTMSSLLTPTGKWGEPQVFEVVVSDNNDVERVSLFYRYTGDAEFTEIEMLQTASDSRYSASIETSDIETPKEAIEFYILAADAAENVMLNGFAFDPLVINIVSETQSEITDTTSAEPEVQSKVNWLYVALGALVVGGIAAAASGGGDGGSVVDEPCEPTCAVTFTINPP